MAYSINAKHQVAIIIYSLPGGWFACSSCNGIDHINKAELRQAQLSA